MELLLSLLDATITFISVFYIELIFQRVQMYTYVEVLHFSWWNENEVCMEIKAHGILVSDQWPAHWRDIEVLVLIMRWIRSLHGNVITHDFIFWLKRPFEEMFNTGVGAPIIWLEVIWTLYPFFNHISIKMYLFFNHKNNYFF